MKIKSGELTGSALDWAVAKCEGIDTRNNACVWFLPFESESDDPLAFLCCADDEAHAIEQCVNAYPDCTVDRVEHIGPHNYSSDWSQGGPIVEREHIGVYRSSGQWIAEWWPDNSGMARNPAQRFQHNRFTCGPTPLVAAMRTYVASKLGDTVDVPDDLV